ncbi:MAG: DUF1592 domain-containing protein [Lentisphaeraceae bacterium]|nr:DUF1592 domain-containing protein [Lentisphaeraceae bacterium]
MSLSNIAVLSVFFCVSFMSTSTADIQLPESTKKLIQKYCFDCHDSEISKGDLNLEPLLDEGIGRHTEIWEKVVRQVDARQMPPIGKKRPDSKTYIEMVSSLTTQLDQHASENPNPGRTSTLRRLTRTEYKNAIRDLLGLEIDASEFLPVDSSSHGFDNITVSDLSPALLERYISAAQKISRLAIGSSLSRIDARTIRIAPDITQENHVEGLPLGTRGGVLVSHNFPQDGEYDIQVHLTRDRNEEVEGLNGNYDIHVLLDGKKAGDIKVQRPRGGSHNDVDKNLKERISVKGGLRNLGVTFVKKAPELIQHFREPTEARVNLHRSPRLTPAIFQVTITGPYNGKGPGNTLSRKLILTENPKNPGEEKKCAEKILSKLIRKAFRRPVEPADLIKPIEFFESGRVNGGSFEAGIESALSAILVSRQFLFRVEKDPKEIKAGGIYKINDVDLASRLSFFIWSSIPDEELLDLAEKGELSKVDVLEAQLKRMLKDPKSDSLVTNFADQWLYLRNLKSITPDGRIFPDFDDNLRDAMRQETELLFESVMKEDKSVLNMLQTDEVHLNERLAKHYDIPHIYGTRFRKVKLDPKYKRGGLLRHASILMVTSYATRTSPVIRGHWILENLLGCPPPPPPPNVEGLDESKVAANLPIRQRLEEHRKNSACKSCHNILDPIGFALENFDAVGRWRTKDMSMPVDARGGFLDGSEFEGVDGLEKAMLDRPDLFVRTLTEKLMIYALGRGLESYDIPSVRQILKSSKEKNYSFSSIVSGIVQSRPFNWRLKK